MDRIQEQLVDILALSIPSAYLLLVSSLLIARYWHWSKRQAAGYRLLPFDEHSQEDDASSLLPRRAGFGAVLKAVALILSVTQLGLCLWDVVRGDGPNAVGMMACAIWLFATAVRALVGPSLDLAFPPDAPASTRPPHLLSHFRVLYATTFAVQTLQTYRASSWSSLDDQFQSRHLDFTHIIAALLSLFLSINDTLLALRVAKEEEDLQNEWVEVHTADDGIKPFVPSRYDQASFWSLLTYGWVTPLINAGNKKCLEEDDVWALPEDDTAAVAVNLFESVRTRYKSLIVQLAVVVAPFFSFQLLSTLLASFANFGSPFFLNRLIKFIEYPTGEPISAGLLYAFAMFACAMIRNIFEQLNWHLGRRVGMRCRSIVIAELFRKSLRRAAGRVSISNEESKEESGNADTDGNANASVGKIVTLMSVDAGRVNVLPTFLAILIVTPLTICITIAFLLKVLGWPALGGVVVMILTIPVTIAQGNYFSRVEERFLECSDKRMSIMNEILQGIRLIKMYAWEGQFMEKVKVARKQELRNLVKLMFAEALGQFIWHCGPLIVAFVTFVTFTKIAGRELDASTAFTSLALFNTLRLPLVQFPDLIVYLLDTLVSLRRIEAFLKQDELDKFKQDKQSDEEVLSDNKDGPVVGFRDASFTWAASSENHDGSGDLDILQGHSFTLRRLDVTFAIGAFSVICGATGAGKSSLLQALLGEMTTLQGHGYLPDSRNTGPIDPTTGFHPGVAYVSQTAWLQNASIRDNICFGDPYDPIRYNKVVRACALVKDFETLAGGDLTEIGEKGINLSGGQKQRISLARAAYSKASFILLDDPLSAVDAPTAKHLFEQCLLGVMAGRTRILVTHAVGLTVPRTDFVVILKEGKVVAQGSPADVATHPQTGGILTEDMLSSTETSSTSTETSNVTDAELSVEDHADGRSAHQVKKLVQDEQKESGAVRFAVYKSYGVAVGGYLYVAVILAVMIVERLCQVALDLWLQKWAEAYGEAESGFHSTSFERGSKPAEAFNMFWAYTVRIGAGVVWDFSPTPSTNITTLDDKVALSSGVDVNYYIVVYALIAIGFVLVNQLNYIVNTLGHYRASKSYHDSMLRRVLNAPMRFFEVTPLGRILNRFSKDISAIDKDMGLVGDFLMDSSDFLVVLAVITVISPMILLAVPVIAIAYVSISGRYLTASRELKRLDSVTRSPIYSHFSEALVGAPTIRAYGQEPRFLSDNLNRIDANHRPYYYLWAANRWLSFRTNSIGACLVLLTALTILFTSDVLGPGLAALSLTYSLILTDTMLSVVRVHNMMEMTMNAVERVEEYLTIEQEGCLDNGGVHPPQEWPSHGKVDIKGISLRYADDQPLVLKDLSFTIHPGQKIGVIGRTGAGKSTLFLALFRIIKYAKGTIDIDGVDITNVNLHDLRSRLTIIPQEPVLFSGTVRSNLDPVSEHDDASMWSALRRVRLLESLQSKEMNTENSLVSTVVRTDSAAALGEATPTEENSSSSEHTGFSLDAPVLENGSNFSQGQRQLLCLARALLRSSKVVVLDEATASVDYETDSRVQETIRAEFAGSTILCIAHRLRTVADYDHILVLDKGELVESGTPAELVERENGWFRRMCLESGEFEEITQIINKS
ncbi:uncharacterized protein SPPG_04647 [Spizellomyces punctatus DAOM BR117]|uniref:P-loop containing nucleoside triphosphate hydrolase protein n=1 Tax=Spizellomyces punctatus (strain DAOM BR117) TaxID=645134 RepID=A0A0L0HGT4_SPIPD|nr:uncharacterized protein SPPG_04647 [Spizellomyces punctatus DAOM BR117]KND00323.1 hypothetical protein SPPG_04647 [Spizellomyces punctatus DAOM BR117]|eukprot:XP_016608362.1 hypothetical protein SPPG_04647 [Spizellomyces punctatus DAOM BR117]